ncbi:MAG: lipoprotein signal peptidase [Tunicatimonas sp.]|uniref:lipoprotein signal peptidase n=1 Tax=Tunicatimonas sp. TaxID=1940096 RepID=UPI003C756E22
MKYWKYYLLSIGIIILDHTVKLLVHNNMDMGVIGQIPVFGDWFKLHYTLNPGMAFGMELGSEYGKLILTIFRLFAMVGIAYYLYALAKKKVHSGLLWSVALILGGAIGNVIDSALYGVLLDNAPYGSSTPWFHGQVIDMFYVDIWEGRVADWVPIWGGKYMALWPIFNIADASIFVGVAIILIFQNRFFNEKESRSAASEVPASQLENHQPSSLG